MKTVNGWKRRLGSETQCEVSVADGTPMAVKYAGIKAENIGGKSPYVTYATLTIGTPFTLPMSDNFRTGKCTYNPIIDVKPNSSYSGKHALAEASKYGVTNAEDGQYAMVFILYQPIRPKPTVSWHCPSSLQ